ncbi:MAG: sulfotransferase domain-containing protein [Oscillatoria sp. SIO1A7]|nr:sulfotransferase domain-containing protein [Oscillatoria sp. SIO1A7]
MLTEKGMLSDRDSYSEDGEVFIISFPKSGRTWLRLLLGKVFALHFSLKYVNLLELQEISYAHSSLPNIKVIHDDDSEWKKTNELSTSKKEYADKKVILLVRDIRDIIVSNYFEKTKRSQMYYNGDRNFNGDLSSYVRSDVGSVETLIDFYNIWADNRNVPSDFLLIRYEDMQKNIKAELLKVLCFLSLPSIPEELVKEAIEYASFENMRKLEIDNAFNSFMLKPGDKNDPESYKVRRGKVGGFVDYLNEADLKWINQKINLRLSNFYAYYKTCS